LFLESVTIQNIRNIAKTSFIFSAGTVVFTGENAQGKTNILEALFLLSHARSFRDARNEHLVKQEEEIGSVQGRLISRDRETDMRIVIQMDTRTAFINGKKCSRLSELAGLAHFVTFVSSDLTVLKGPPGDRRNFFDRFIYNLYPGYLLILKEYKQVLRQRNSLLPLISEARASYDELESWDKQLIDLGSSIVKKRIELIKTINNKITEKYNFLSSLNSRTILKYHLSLKGLSENSFNSLSLKEIADVMKNNLDRNRQKEIDRGHTITGPHRDDFSIFLDDNDIRHFGSQGEIRSMIISLKLIELDLFKEQRRDTPILILDDVFSELDSTRSKKIFTRLERDTQTFISTTSLHDLTISAEKALIFEIRKGETCLKN